jgi:lysophospholipase L1-like esterase
MIWKPVPATVLGVGCVLLAITLSASHYQSHVRSTLGFLWCARSVTTDTRTRMHPRILLMGDSITQQSFMPGGWGAAVADWYSRRADVVNRGFSGYNTRWVRHHKEEAAVSIPAGGPIIWGTLFLGANDAAGNHQNVPLEEYEANLKDLARWLLNTVGVQRLIIMGPPPMDPEKHILVRGLKPEEETRTDAAHEQYAARAGKVADSLGLPFVDVRRGIMEALGDSWKDGLRDGLHLSTQGSSVVFELLKKTVADHFGDEVLPTDEKPVLLPYHATPSLHAIPAFPADADGN